MYGAPIYSLWLMCFDWRQGPDLYYLWYLSGYNPVHICRLFMEAAFGCFAQLG